MCRDAVDQAGAYTRIAYRHSARVMTPKAGLPIFYCLVYTVIYTSEVDLMRKAKAAVRKGSDDSEAENPKLPTAKLFQNGRSQAVRLPKEYRFEGSEIGVGRVGNAVILYPLNDPWAVFFEGAEELAQADLDPLKRDQEQSKRRFEK